MNEERIFLATPTRGAIYHGTHAALYRATRRPDINAQSFSSSLLTMAFNSLWCTALNARPIDYFAMIHDDIVPSGDWWLDRMIDELRRSGADVLSVVMPIKDERGLTSTSFMAPSTGKMRRLTMRQAAKLPPTFDAALAGHPGKMLLPNTGLWVCDFTKPWVEKICFTVRDRNFKDGGAWVTQCFSEDWDFGVQCAALGLRVCVTRAIEAVHIGEFKYPNFQGWGSLETDDASIANGVFAPDATHAWPHLERLPLHKRAVSSRPVLETVK